MARRASADAAPVGMDPLVERVAGCIDERSLIPKGSPLVAAVSGGPDSMVLLHVLVQLAESRNWRLTVAHFNHHLRGRSSDADQRLVERAARRVKLQIIVGSGDPRSLAAAEGISLEMAARKLRHAFLAQAAGQTGARRIALAHQADDQVELFFLRLLRGSSPEGLAGMKWASPSPASKSILLVRPLLDFSRGDLVAFARQQHIAYREDATNRCLDMQRNLLRHKILPLLRRTCQPALTRSILRTMEILGAESDYVGSSAEEWLKQRRGTKSASAFAEAPVALQRRFIHAGLVEQGIVPTFEVIEALRRKPGSPVCAAAGVRVVLHKDGRILRELVAPAREIRSSEVTVSLRELRGGVQFNGVALEWERRRLKGIGKVERTPGQEWFDADKVGDQVLLRHWRPGDRFQPAGMACSVKLQDLFTNLKIPRSVRHELVVAANGSGQIFWVEGFRISEGFKLSGETRHRLGWRWRRAM